MNEQIVAFFGPYEWATLKELVRLAHLHTVHPNQLLLEPLARQIAQAETRRREQPGGARLAAAAPDLLTAVHYYLGLDNDLAEDDIPVDEEPGRWADCHRIAAEALTKAGVQLPPWLAYAVMVQEEQS